MRRDANERQTGMNDDVERPIPSGPSNKLWGSDPIASVLGQLDIPYVALNPGASYRGFHDSIVNHLGNRSPQMVLCLHEEHAVAIAHGYAKVTGKPMAVIVHSNVGLMHATMAIFNAWCDRQPVIIFGATGPLDAAKRRPWIDWLHTTIDQASMLRNYIKWDAQPVSAAAATEALLRANMIAQTAPKGPVFITLDVSLQEQELNAAPPMPDVSRFRPPQPPAPSAESVAAAADLLAAGKKPVMLVGRCGRNESAWQARIALAETLGCRVLTDSNTGATFPSLHALHGAGTDGMATPESSSSKMIAESDVILSLDWIELGGTIRAAFGSGPITAKIIQISSDQHSHNGWNMEHFGLAPMDIYMLSEPDTAVPLLLAAVKARRSTKSAWPKMKKESSRPPLSALGKADVIEAPMIATALKEATGNDPVTLLTASSRWTFDHWDIEHHLDAIGADGGGGIGSGPGIAVGAALALRGKARLPIAVIGDGDMSMGMSALWTAAHYRIPVLFVVANNRSYFNDELHQDRVARVRGRRVENRWIGQVVRDPDLDFAGLARAQGCVGIGPVTHSAKLVEAMKEAVATLRSGKPCVIDVRIAGSYGDTLANAAFSRGDGREAGRRS